jgi:hypothetical protein
MGASSERATLTAPNIRPMNRDREGEYPEVEPHSFKILVEMCKRGQTFFAKLFALTLTLA